MNKTQRASVPDSEHQYVRSITPGTAVNTVLAIAEAVRKEARNGPFWIVELKDATGNLPARIWSPLAQQFEDIPSGRLALVEGRAERYREQTQLSVTALRLLSDEETAVLDTTAFMPSSARSPLLMFDELEALADAVLTHVPWRDFLRRALHNDDIRTRLLKATAAKGIHHARVGGLLEHTLGVVRLCLHFAERYPQLDRQTLFVGAVCHDLGKLWELTSGLSTEYTDEGRLAGHIFLGLEHLRPHIEAAGLAQDQVLHLQHLILSHHGEYAYGSPRLPQTAEAIALHYADNMDAKMDQFRALFSDIGPEEGVWSPYQKSLERAVYRAPRTPLEDFAASVAENEAFSRNGGLENNFAENDFPDDFPQENIPLDEYPEEIPQDDFPENDFPEEQVASDEECVFEHLTDDKAVDQVLASMSEKSEKGERSEHEGGALPVAATPKEQSQPGKTREAKTRLEVRQCSLL